jgi:hypothetical protein
MNRARHYRADACRSAPWASSWRPSKMARYVELRRPRRPRGHPDARRCARGDKDRSALGRRLRAARFHRRAACDPDSRVLSRRARRAGPRRSRRRAWLALEERRTLARGVSEGGKRRARRDAHCGSRARRGGLGSVGCGARTGTASSRPCSGAPKSAPGRAGPRQQPVAPTSKTCSRDSPNVCPPQATRALGQQSDRQRPPVRAHGAC